MKKLLTLIRQYYHYLYLAFIFLATIVVICLMFPEETRFKYEFQKGSPWRHSTLFAPFDFAVLKSDAELLSERDSVLKSYAPYFQMDTVVGKQKEAELLQGLRTFQDTLRNTRSSRLARKVPQLLKRIYREGVLSSSIDSYRQLDGKQLVMIVKGNQATNFPVDKLHSIKSAYKLLDDSIRTWAGSGYQDFVGRLNLSELLTDNLTYDEALNQSEVKELTSSISLTKGMVPAGVRIIFEGDMVGPDEFVKLESLKKAYETRRGEDLDSYLVFGGEVVLVVGCLLVLFLFLLFYRREIFDQKRHVSFIFLMIALMVFLAGVVSQIPSASIYIVPLAILPILVRIFFDSRTAIFVLMVTTLLIGFFAPNNYEYILIQLIAGIVAVFSLNKLHRRSHLVITSFWVLITYATLFVAMSLIQEGNLATIEWRRLIWFGLNGLLIFLAYPLIWVFEKIFGFVSDVTLMELSDTNQQPLLRQLAEEAPGTFQHSLQVANLAEQVIHRIGGNPFLVRAGALYHDIGKIRRPGFFIENQAVGINPHSRLDPKKSSEVIVDHVINGIRMARKHGLPEILINFIATHHGTTQTGYFYTMYKNENPDAAIDPADFSYPGPIPTSKECAVVMLVDGIEAAARSLPEKTFESLKELIETMVDKKINGGQLDNAELTFRDIRIFKETILEKLKNIYHLRIEYPK